MATQVKLRCNNHSNYNASFFYTTLAVNVAKAINILLRLQITNNINDAPIRM